MVLKISKDENSLIEEKRPKRETTFVAISGHISPIAKLDTRGQYTKYSLECFNLKQGKMRPLSQQNYRVDCDVATTSVETFLTRP